MTPAEAAKRMGCSVQFLREAIDQGECDVGICVRMPGSTRRTFLINERKVEEWIHGNQSQSGPGSD